MGFFQKLKKLSLGGLVAQKLTGGEKNEGGFLMGLAKGPKKPEPPAPFDPGNRPGSNINGQSGVDMPAMRLGWTNNGRQYANSPFNGANPSYYTPPSAGMPPQGGGAPPMSFGGTGGSNMGASGPQMLQNPGGPASMPPAGAQPPTRPPNGMVQIPEQQQALISGLRAR